jgi:hypothetical protein
MLRKFGRLAVAGGLVAVALFAPAAGTSAASPNLYATVNADGTLANGNGVSSVSHTFNGQYEVTFTSNVSGCAYEATTQNSGPSALQVFTAGGHLSANGVYLEVKNQAGGLTDGPFDLAVACGLTGWQYAVVGYTANLVRSSAGATLAHPGTGKYNVTFTSAVNRCAFLATVGDPTNQLVFNPAGVYTQSGPSNAIVSVETKNTAGGLANGIPFHLAVICSNAMNTSEIVVNANGLPARGSSLISSFNASTGNYVIATGQSLAACTFIATRGSVNKAVPFSPATIEITPGPAVNTQGIQERQLAFFGGALTNQDFHAAAVC